MTVSVLIPAYNAAPYLDRTVPAVLQLKAVHEWIWVDDGSTDETFSHLCQLTKDVDRVRLLRHPVNRGRAAARNTAIAAATGDIFALLDADACPRSGYVEAHRRALSDERAVASVGRVVPADLDDTDPYAAYLRSHPRGPSTRNGTTSWKHFIAGVACVRASTIREWGGFNLAISYGEDAELACRLSTTYPDGLHVAADAIVDLYGTEPLSGVLEKARQFGAALPSLLETCPEALTRLGLVGLESSFNRALLDWSHLEGLMRWLLSNGPRVLVPFAVRYLLAEALHRGYTDA